VFYNTAADKAGIRKGDQILSIDGRAVNGLSIGFAEALLTGDANTEAVVEVERDNHKRATIKYRRESIFATSEVPHIGIGIDVAATSGGRLIISGVRDHAPGQEAGLKVNDEIVAVNDLQVASTSLDKISAQMKQPEGTVIKLTIRRQGEDKLLEFKVTVRKLP
jgi:C-terminal processing protease CtpA/Prc